MATINDQSTYDHDGTTVGGPIGVPGYAGKGIDLNGVDEYITTPDSTDLEVTQFTVMAWVYLRGTGATQAIWCNWDSPYGYWMKINTSDQLIGAIGNGSSQTITAPDPLPLNTYSHCTFTFDGSLLKLYVNGRLVAQEDATTSVSFIPDCTAVAGALSNDNGVTYAQFLNGILDELYVYSVARTQCEINTYIYDFINNKNFEQKVRSLCPVHYWQFDETSGTEAIDETAFNESLTYWEDAVSLYAPASQFDARGTAKRTGLDPAPPAPLVYYSMDVNNGSNIIFQEITPDPLFSSDPTDITLTNAVLDAGGYNGSTGISTTNSGSINGEGAMNVGSGSTFYKSTLQWSASIRLKTSGVTAPLESNLDIGLFTMAFNGSNAGWALFITKVGEANEGTLVNLIGYAEGSYRGFSRSPRVDDGNWHIFHITCNAEVLTLYLDGVQYDQRDYSADTVSDVGGSALLLRRTGKDSALGIILDDVKTYPNVALTADQVAVDAGLTVSSLPRPIIDPADPRYPLNWTENLYESPVSFGYNTEGTQDNTIGIDTGPYNRYNWGDRIQDEFTNDPFRIQTNDHGFGSNTRLDQVICMSKMIRNINNGGKYVFKCEHVSGATLNHRTINITSDSRIFNMNSNLSNNRGVCLKDNGTGFIGGVYDSSPTWNTSWGSSDVIVFLDLDNETVTLNIGGTNQSTVSVSVLTEWVAVNGFNAGDAVKSLRMDYDPDLTGITLPAGTTINDWVGWNDWTEWQTLYELYPITNDVSAWSTELDSGANDLVQGTLNNCITWTGRLVSPDFTVPTTGNYFIVVQQGGENFRQDRRITVTIRIDDVDSANTFDLSNEAFETDSFGGGTITGRRFNLTAGQVVNITARADSPVTFHAVHSVFLVRDK